MDQDFVVCIHYENDYGWIRYDEATKTCQVKLANETKRREIEEYLTTPKTVYVARGATIRDFTNETGVPTDSLEFFKENLTRLWNYTKVLVDWSHPVQE